MLGGELDEAIDEVRRLARGVYPSLLTSYGLERALRAAVRGSPVRATVRTDGVGRLRPTSSARCTSRASRGSRTPSPRHGRVRVDISLASATAT